MPQLLLNGMAVPDYTAVQEAKEVRTLGVDIGGFVSSVDLESGSVTVDGERYDVQHPGAPLRPIYYKRMAHTTGGETQMQFVALGWQSTVDGSNVRFGVKLYPSESRWELGSDL